MSRTSASSPAPPPILSTLLLVAAGLAAASAGWAAFLWQQLLVSRGGEEPFCALGGTGCAALWDGAFANGVHAWTGLPVAAWGVVWGVAATVCALLAWRGLGTRQDPEPGWTAMQWLALGGAVAVIGLVVAGVQAGEFCSNCTIIQGLAGGYVGTVFAARSAFSPSAGRAGAVLAGALVAGGFVLLLWPGLATPKAGSTLAVESLPDAAPQDPEVDPLDAVRSLLARLGPRERQALANARAAYLDATPVEVPPARGLHGDPFAPMRLTTFTDSGCGHCATFHEALEKLLVVLPPNRLSVESRVFPLDDSCNPAMRAGGRPEVCLAAQVRVCLEDDPKAFALAGWLHDDATPLGTDTIYAVAERLAPRAELEACVASAETARKIVEDVELGMRAGLQGTPFLLLNGRPTAAVLPFLYALILTGGDAEHEIFAGLPEPTAVEPGHEGHNH